MNYLINIYRRFRNAEFIEKINKTLMTLENSRNLSMNLVLQGSDIVLQGSLQCSSKDLQKELAIEDESTAECHEVCVIDD